MAKRMLDFLLSLSGFVLLLPVFAIVAISIKLDSAGPILFRQQRVGLGGAPFWILKFRTMHPNAEKQGGLTIGDDFRVTRSGRFLRRYKLDELPQLLNVIVGDMSLVGPRPELREYFDLYPPDAKLAMTRLRPGITGPGLWMLFNENELLAQSADPQSSYISEIVPIKARDIVQYAADNSLLGDLKIILCTLGRVVRRRSA